MGLEGTFLKRGRKPITDWSAVDWTKSSIQLAKELHCTSCIVSFRRKALNAPKAPRLSRYGKGWKRAEKILAGRDVSDLTSDEVAKLVGSNRRFITGFLKKKGIPYRKRMGGCYTGRSFQFEGIDWKLPTSELIRQTGYSASTIERYRKESGINPPRTKRGIRSKIRLRILALDTTNMTVNEIMKAVRSRSRINVYACLRVTGKAHLSNRVSNKARMKQ